MNKVYQLTIGISALNEDLNIQNLLRSVISQNENGFIINEIIVISDGSTDNTVEKVKEITDKRIRLISFKNRAGKAQRLNQIFKLAKGNLIVLLDADCILASNETLFHLIYPFTHIQNVGLTSGRAIPLPGKTFIEKCINVSYIPYDNVRDKIKSGNNPFSAEGKILCLSKGMANSIKIPKNMFADDNYLYFWCITNNYRFIYTKSAAVRYRSPSTLRDQIKQNTRFLSRDSHLEKIFGEIVSREYKIPRLIFCIELMKVILRQPIHSLSIFIINAYCRYLVKKGNYKKSDKWDMVKTTKQII